MRTTPKLRYLVNTPWEGDRVLNALIAKLLDENGNRRHGYSCDELVVLLDRHVALRSACRGDGHCAMRAAAGTQADRPVS